MYMYMYAYCLKNNTFIGLPPCTQIPALKVGNQNYNNTVQLDKIITQLLSICIHSKVHNIIIHSTRYRQQ